MNPIDTFEQSPNDEADTLVFASDDGLVRRERRRRESDRMKAPSARMWDGPATQRREPKGQRATINLRDC